MASPNRHSLRHSSHRSPAHESTSYEYTPRSPVLPSFSSQAQAQAQTQPYTQAQNLQSYQVDPQTSFSPYSRHSITDYSTTQYLPPSVPLSNAFTNPPPSYFPPPPVDHDYHYTDGAHSLRDENNLPLPPPPPMSRTTRSHAGASSSSAPPPAPAQPLVDESSDHNHDHDRYRNPNPHNIEIRTKFPVARIKRIMQADEEVGKVAQVTPVAVSKALELFMIGLVTGAAEKAREKGGKRITAQHLKMVVEGDEQFDFLGDIVRRVMDGGQQEGAGGAGAAGAEGKRRKKREGSSESEVEPEVERDSGRRKKGKGRRRKADD